MWKCPNCEANIEYLNYDVDTRESGTANLTRREMIDGRIEEHNIDDTEWNGSVEYQCPECENCINPDNLIWNTGETTAPNPVIVKEPEEIPPIVKPIQEIQINYRGQEDQSKSTMICKHCFHVFIYRAGKARGWVDEDGEYFDCPKCGLQNNKKEYLMLIETRYFNHIKTIKLKKHVKKITHRRIKSLDVSSKSVSNTIPRP